MPINPGSLSGLRLWLRAKDLGSGGSSVTTWPDQSGRSNSPTSVGTAPTVAASSTPSGGKSVAFSAGYFSVPSPMGGAVAGSPTASTQVGGFEAAKAFDTDPNTCWAATTSTGWIRWQPPSGAPAATSYSVKAYNAGNQAPATWTLEGSNDASSWTTLDSRSGVTFSAFETKQYTFSNSTAWAYYRLNCTANGGAANLAIGEIWTDSWGSPTDAEMWIVVKANAGNNGSPVEVSRENLEGYYPFSGVVYDGFGGTRQSFTPSLSITSWRLFRATRNATTREWFLDDASQLSVSAGTVKWTAAGFIGTGASASGVAVQFSGNIAEILIRGAVSTSTEIADLITYFNTEHGLTVAGGSADSTTGTVSATASAPTLSVAGTVTTTGQVAATASAPTLSVTGTVTGPTVTGSVSATASAPTLTVTGNVTTPTITGTVSATAPHPTLSVTPALDVEWEELESYTEGWATVSETLTVAIDPVTLRPAYSLKVVDMHGDVLCELTEASIGTSTRTLNGRGGLSFVLPKLSPEVAMVQQFSEVQLWRGGHLVPGGWYVVKEAGIEVDDHVVGYQCPGLSYHFERRIIGGDRPELLLNGGFEQGARFWNFGWSPNGTSGRPPDHLLTRDACEGGKALVVDGDSDNHRQFAWQGFTYTNTHPTQPLWIDIQAQCRIDDYDGPSKDQWMLYADVRPSDGSTTILYQDSVRIDETDPLDSWIPMSIRVKIAANTTAWVQVRLYPPHGRASFDQVSAKADTTLYLKGDPWQVMQELVEEAQNVANGKSDLNIYTYGSWSGFKIQRPYPWKSRTLVSEAMDEIVRSRNGPDANMEVGARIRRLTVAPKQGARIGYLKPVFALGDRAGDVRILSYSAGIDGDEVATTAIVQSSWSGGGMTEVIVRSPRPDGLVLEKLYQAEQDTPTSSLYEQGRTAVQYGRADVITKIVMHPEDTNTLLEQGITIGAVVTLDIHDGEIDVRADYRIVQIDLDPNRDQYTYTVVPEV